MLSGRRVTRLTPISCGARSGALAISLVRWMETPRLAARLAKEQTASANPSLPRLTSPRYRGSRTTSAADPNQDRPWPTRKEKTLRTKCRPLGALGGEFWAVEGSCEAMPSRVAGVRIERKWGIAEEGGSPPSKARTPVLATAHDDRRR